MLYSAFKVRNHWINHCVHLKAFYMLQSNNSHNLGRIKRYGNPPNLIETRSFFSSPHHALWCIQFLRVKKNWIYYCFFLDEFYLLQSTDSRNFSRSKCYSNFSGIKCHGNPPKLLETRLLCLLTTLCSVLYSNIKVRKTSDQPSWSSRCVLSAAINQLSQFKSDQTIWKYPHANRNPLMLSLPHVIICAGFNF